MARKYQIVFNEETEYGQDVLNLAGLVAMLMDDQTAYKKQDLYNILGNIKKESERLWAQVWKAKNDYFQGGQ